MVGIRPIEHCVTVRARITRLRYAGGETDDVFYADEFVIVRCPESKLRLPTHSFSFVMAPGFVEYPPPPEMLAIQRAASVVEVRPISYGWSLTRNTYIASIDELIIDDGKTRRVVTLTSTDNATNVPIFRKPQSAATPRELTAAGMVEYGCIAQH